MPLTKSLAEVARQYYFRPLLPGEDEQQYRELLAQRMERFDFIAAQEIRLQMPWDKWTEEQKARALGLYDTKHTNTP